MLTVAIIGAFILMLLAPCVVAFMGRKETHATVSLPVISAQEPVPVPEALPVQVALGKDQVVTPVRLSPPPPSVAARVPGPETGAAQARMLAAEAGAALLKAEAKVARVRAEFAAEIAAAAGRAAQEAIAAAGAARQIFGETLQEQPVRIEPEADASLDQSASIESTVDPTVRKLKVVGRRAA